MAHLGKLLLVGVVDEDGAALGRALESRGHEVVHARSVEAAPIQALELGPDAVVIDAAVGVIELRAAIDLLRNHPKTEAAHLIVMDFGEMSHVTALDARAEPILKPFFVPEVVAHIGAILDRKHEAKDPGELHGELAQVSLFDLLQVLSSNRRTGRLRIEGDRMAGDVWIDEGRIVDATQGYSAGEKAMYRLLSVDTGRFVFTPALVTTAARIDAGTEALLMEGVRRIDEMKKLAVGLPGERARFRVALTDLDLPPLAQALLTKLEAPSLLREILDLSDAPDLEILEMLLLLIETGVVEIDEASMNARLASDEGTEMELRSALLRLRRRGVEGPIRLGVLSSDRAALSRFSRALGLLPEFVPPAAAPVPLGRGLLGELGRIRISAADLQLFAIPTDLEHRPLVGALLGGARVALHLDPLGEEETVGALTEHLGLTIVEFDATSDHPARAAAGLRKALAVE